MFFGPPSSPPMDFLLRRTKTRTAITASEQKRVTLKASLVKKIDHQKFERINDTVTM